MSEPMTAIVIVNYGSHELLRRNAVPLAEETDHLVVVDSFSSAPERTAVRALAADHGWHVVTPEENTGFGGGVNLGVERARELGATVVAMVNPDVWAGPGALDTLLRHAAAHPNRLIAPTIRRPDGEPYSRGKIYVSLEDGIMRSAARPPRSPRERAWLSGACLALSMQLWDRLGGFDHGYFLYWEDVDFSIRAQDAGAVLDVVDGLEIVHDEGATHRDGHSDRAKSELYYYYNIRNRLRFAARCLAPEDQERWRRTSLGAARAIVLQGGRRQLVQGLAPWRAALRGTRDGWRELRAARPTA